MADYINKIRTTEGDKPVNYEALANKPHSLPNPNKIKFTGSVVAEYDGSSEVTVNIPNSASEEQAAQIQTNTNDISELKNKTSELKSDLVNIFINREYNFTESGTTELFAYAGTTVMIEVSQISGSFNVFTLGNTTHGIFGISKTGVYKFIPQYDGYIRFYTESENASITFKIYLKTDTVFTTDIDARIENMYLYDASPTINDIAIKTRRVNKSIIQNSWGYDLKPGNTIFNLLDAKITSSIQKTTNVIRVRDSAGCLIYNLDINDKASIPKETNAICMYVFDRLGNFLDRKSVV